MCPRKFCNNITAIYLICFSQKIWHISTICIQNPSFKRHSIQQNRKIPKVSKKQVTIQKLGIHRLYRLILSKNPEQLFILDDKSYFTFNGSNMPQNYHYYSTRSRFTKNYMKYRCMAKFQS